MQPTDAAVAAAIALVVVLAMIYNRPNKPCRTDLATLVASLQSLSDAIRDAEKSYGAILDQRVSPLADQLRGAVKTGLSEPARSIEDSRHNLVAQMNAMTDAHAASEHVVPPPAARTATGTAGRLGQPHRRAATNIPTPGISLRN